MHNFTQHTWQKHKHFSSSFAHLKNLFFGGGGASYPTGWVSFTIHAWLIMALVNQFMHHVSGRSLRTPTQEEPAKCFSLWHSFSHWSSGAWDLGKCLATVLIQKCADDFTMVSLKGKKKYRCVGRPALTLQWGELFQEAGFLYIGTCWPCIL